MLLTAKAKVIVGAVAMLAVVVLFISYGEWRAAVTADALEQKHEAAVLKMRVEAARELAAQVTYTLGVERDLREAHARNEEQSREHDRITGALEKRLITVAARSGGRLRDPNAEGCRGGGGGAAAAASAAAGGGAGSGAETGGLLSAPLTGLLLELQREADRINGAYAACRPDAIKLRERLSPP